MNALSHFSEMQELGGGVHHDLGVSMMQRNRLLTSQIVSGGTHGD